MSITTPHNTAHHFTTQHDTTQHNTTQRNILTKTGQALHGGSILTPPTRKVKMRVCTNLKYNTTIERRNLASSQCPLSATTWAGSQVPYMHCEGVGLLFLWSHAMAKTCKDCPYYEPNPDRSDTPQCRRNPPVVMFRRGAPQERAIWIEASVFPSTRPSVWCGVVRDLEATP